MLEQLLGEVAIGALKKAIEEAPEIGKWVSNLLDGAPDTPDNRRVKDILPERSESEKVAEELRRK